MVCGIDGVCNSKCSFFFPVNLVICCISVVYNLANVYVSSVGKLFCVDLEGVILFERGKFQEH